MKQVEASIGKQIESLDMRADEDNYIRLKFKDGTGLYLYDAAQDCCEKRYMTTDDELADASGTFLGIEVKTAEVIVDEGFDHETQFVEIKTTSGSFTFVNHNEHNGYYGGFDLMIRELIQEKAQ